MWNGNTVSGQDALGEFFESLPSSEFQVHTLDCQPVHGEWNQYSCKQGGKGTQHYSHNRLEALIAFSVNLSVSYIGYGLSLNMLMKQLKRKKYMLKIKSPCPEL